MTQKIILSGGFGYGFVSENLIESCMYDIQLIVLIERMCEAHVIWSDTKIDEGQEGDKAKETKWRECANKVKTYIDKNYEWLHKDRWLDEESWYSLFVEELDSTKRYILKAEDGGEWVEEFDSQNLLHECAWVLNFPTKE